MTFYNFIDYSRVSLSLFSQLSLSDVSHESHQEISIDHFHEKFWGSVFFIARARFDDELWQSQVKTARNYFNHRLLCRIANMWLRCHLSNSLYLSYDFGFRNRNWGCFLPEIAIRKSSLKPNIFIFRWSSIFLVICVDLFEIAPIFWWFTRNFNPNGNEQELVLW